MIEAARKAGEPHINWTRNLLLSAPRKVESSAVKK
jgi:hypothetical protein